jgi:hypothetical protein
MAAAEVAADIHSEVAADIHSEVAADIHSEVAADIHSEVAAATTRAALLMRARHISHRAATAALIIQPGTPRARR